MGETVDARVPAPQANDAAVLRDALARILASEPFVRAGAARALLQALVDRRAAGIETAIDETALGVDVLRRPASYDPRADPIVRVQMRQLRLKLGAYYAAEGQTDPVRLDIPKGEYRVVVTPSPAARLPVAPAMATPDALPAASAAPRTVARHARWPIAAAGVLLLLVVGWVAWNESGSRHAPVAAASPVPSVAVLPFEHAGRDEALAAFSDSLTDELLVALVRLDGLRVTGRTSSFSQRGVALREAGTRLGVDATISGRVQHVDDRFRVTVRLVRVADERVLWSDAVEGSSDQLLEIQERMAMAVATALRLRIDPSAGQPFVVRGNADTEAHALYLEARRLMAARRTPADLHQSVSLLEQAIARDPGYAMAHASLADVLSTLAFNGHLPPGEGVGRARAAANRALALDPRLGEAHAHLASLSAFVDWEWAEAEARFRDAVRLAPSHARIHTWYGQSLLVQRRFEEALESMRTAQRLDPLAPSVIYAVGEGYLYWGHYDDAIVQARRLLELDARSWGGHNLIARAAFQQGRLDQVRQAVTRSAGELWADVLARLAAGDQPGARTLLTDRHGELAETQPFFLASLYATVGDREAAITWLQRAFERRQIDVVSVTIEPTLAAVRDDPRVRDLVRRLRLPDRAVPSAP